MIQKYKTLKKEITDHDHDNITTPEINKLAKEMFKPKLKQADLVTKTEFKKNSLKGLQVLVVVIIYSFENLKDKLMKELILLLHLIIVLPQN